MAGWIAASRVRGALTGALLCVAVAALLPRPSPPGPDELAPNILIVLTDDQSIDTLPSAVGAPPMPWLQSQIQDPAQPWVTFTNAFLDTPLCCPSRASILTGLTSPHTGVQTNADGFDLDASSTLATWLNDAGYTTGLIGKYLNDFPWDRGPSVPPGWDRFVAKQNAGLDTTYYGYSLIDQGVPQFVASSPQGYATTYLAEEAMSFLRAAPAGEPWFLVYSPPAPHEPWLAAPGDRGAFTGQPVSSPSLREMNDVRGKPAWIRSLLPITEAHRALLLTQRRRASETLLEVDRVMQAMTEQVRARGELDRTIIVFLTDNGFSFGEHRWTGKRCPYEACVRTPLAIRSPWAAHSTVDDLVLNVDLAPTVLDFVASSGTVAHPAVDGASLHPYLDASSTDPPPERPGVLLQYTGDAEVPAWAAVRTREFTFIRTSDGTVELYDLLGRFGEPDPGELRNLADDVRSGSVVAELDSLLESLVRAPTRG
ncbi:MAG TPA: sulfatase [Actinomycetota bacterium]